MDDDIQKVFDCFERTLDAEVTEINTIDAVIEGVEVPPPSSDATRFEVDDSGPFGNPFDPNRIPRPPFAVLDPNRMPAPVPPVKSDGNDIIDCRVAIPASLNLSGFQLTKQNVNRKDVKYYCRHNRSKHIGRQMFGGGQDILNLEP
jgi:hypothetical protein